MYDWIFWLLALAVLCIVGLVMFALGARLKVSTGGHCDFPDVYWWFGRWVRCLGGEHCPPGEVCTLLWRRRGSEETWTDAGVVPGGSVKWSEYMEYRCVCR